MVRARLVPRLLVPLFAFAAFGQTRALTASSGPDVKATTSVGGGRVTPKPASPSASILYEQTDNASGVGVVSQDFESIFNGFDCEGADDFVVPADTTWAIESVSIPGLYFNGSGPAQNVNLTIFHDDAGLPGAVACSYPAQTPADTSGSFVFTLSPACILGSGTYWLDVQARMNFHLDPAGGEWAWKTRSVQGNAPALWRNPLGSITPACTSFAPMATCFGDTTPPDFLFSLSGEVLIVAPVALAVDPPSGVHSPASAGNGVLEMGETVAIVPSWKNDTPGVILLQGLVGNFDGPGGPSYVVDDGTADYSAIPGGATVSCAAATGDCFGVHISGTRPTQHFDAKLTEQPQAGVLTAPTDASTPKVWTLHVGESFTDVPTSNQFYASVETIFHNGVTGGCGGTNYCPNSTTLRKQMAVLLLKAKNGSGYQPPPCTGKVFADVPCTGGSFDPWIEDLHAQGITSGCGDGSNYCPDGPVTRGQMSTLLLKTKNGPGYAPPPCLGTVFTDVPCKGGAFDPWIEDLAAQGITGGCGNGAYCPGNPTTRGQMATFLTRTFGLLLYGP